MREIIEAIAVVLIPVCGFAAILCIIGAISYAWELHEGYMDAPKLRVKGKAARKPQRRGMVGELIKREAYTYLELEPQTDERDLRVRKVRRGCSLTAYGVGTAEPYNIYIWDGEQWGDFGSLKGEEGETGPQGERSPQGP